MPPGYDALRDVLASANTPNPPTHTHRNNEEMPPVAVAVVAATTPAQIPYNPINRRTPPTSVLVPLTPAELESFKIPRHALRVRTKRCDPALENPDFFPPSVRKRKHEDRSDVSEPTPKRSRDSGLVVTHYNSRPDVGIMERRESPIIGLKNFNNWIKSVLIAKFAKPALDDAPITTNKTRGKVLDMGCGKGGDLQKWSKARIAEYVGMDIAAVSVDQARSRWLEQRGRRFEAHFAALDCYTEPIASALPPSVFDTPFDVVSMQFCMHYAFESPSKVHMMLENVSKYLRRGGIFLGTVPNGQWLLDRLAVLPPSSSPSFGNSVYNIRFEQPFIKGAQPPIFGHRYSFFLKDAVEDVPEYVVHWECFERLARDYDLYPLYKREFHDIFDAEREHKEYGPLLQRMKVVTADGESQMDEDQWEAANIYLGFVFEKR